MPEETLSHYDTAAYLWAEKDIAADLDAVMAGSEADAAYVARVLTVVAHGRVCHPQTEGELVPMRLASKRKPPAVPKRTSICLSAEAHKSLRIEALRRDITMSQLIAQALADAGVDIPPEDLET